MLCHDELFDRDRLEVQVFLGWFRDEEEVDFIVVGLKELDVVVLIFDGVEDLLNFVSEEGGDVVVVVILRRRTGQESGEGIGVMIVLSLLVTHFEVEFGEA